MPERLSRHRRIMDGMTDEMPANPLTALSEAAVQLHELFRSYLDAGFTEQQALYLAACVACGGPKGQP